MNIPLNYRNLTPDKLALKASRWLARRSKYLLEELWTRSGGQNVEPWHLPGIVSGKWISPNEAATHVMTEMRTAIDSGNIDFHLARERFPDEFEALLKEADRLCDRKFRILGENIDYSGGIGWHYDPRNDHQFDPTAFHASIQHARPTGGFDIKYPWELSRLQHLPKLALAYRLTREKKYQVALITQAMDWIDQNPLGLGPNWACTMDVSIRAANLSYAFALLDKKIPDDIAIQLVSSLVEHGRFIVSHLEYSEELTSNHYLSDMAGLAVLSCLLATSIPEARDWRDFAHTELESEISKQVYPDGWDFEASTAYHRLVLECFLISAIFLDRSGLPMSDGYRDKLKSMAEFVRDITALDGSFPLIGDNDSGLFMSLQPRELSRMDYLLSLAAAYLDGDSLKPPDLKPSPEIFWLLGEDGLQRFENLPASHRPLAASYPDGGLWISRSDDSRDILTFRLGPLGQNGNGGHAHNDQSSITIRLDGNPVIVDPGSAVYTSDPGKRNLYRSTGSHATIALGDIEQNRFVRRNLFTLPQEVETEFMSIETVGDETYIEGILKGYGPWTADEVIIGRRVTHQRDKNLFEIEDQIKISGGVDRKPVWNFPLAPGLRARESGSGCVRIANHDGDAVAEVLYYPGWRVEMDETHYSPEYGVEEPNITLRFTPPGDEYNSKFIFRTPRLKQSDTETQ